MKENEHKLTAKQYLTPFILITTLFFLWGFSHAILDVLNKHFQNILDISITQSAYIQVMTYLGYFIMALPAGLFIQRFSYRKGVILGLVLFGVGSLLFIPIAYIGQFYAYLIPLFIIGCGLVFLETAANPYVTELGSSKTATSRLNLSQSFNGLGSLFATLVVGQFLFSNTDNDGNIVIPYSILGVLVLCIALVFTRVDLPEIQPAALYKENESMHPYAQLFQHKMFVFGLIALLAYEVAEISINSYFINFVTAQGWMSDNVASVVLTIALALFMVGRFVGSWLMRFIPPRKMLLYCSVASIICMLLILINAGRVSVVALVCNYLFEAIMFPTIFALSLNSLGALTKYGSSILMMMPIGGCTFLLMGYVADTCNVVIPFLIPLVGFVLVMLYALLLCVRKRIEGELTSRKVEGTNIKC